jgi:D-glycero-alpha-D-manno-heptose-7-phosphate kinase
MIIVRTPYRISLFGGGTDFPKWYSEHGGKVLAFSINRYSYLSAKILPPFFSHSYRLSYSQVEEVTHLNQIKHPAFREAIRIFGNSQMLEIHHHGDLPARSGIASSSAFTVGIINALNSINGVFLESAEIAKLAIKFEQDTLNENVGSQDQITCSLGGINLITFNSKEKFITEKIHISESYQNQISERAVLFYTGLSRNSSDVSRLLLENMNKNEKKMSRLVKLAEEGNVLFKNEGNLDSIGEMLNESMKIKSELNPNAVNNKIVELVEHAQRHGALGAKILGAGGGGFCLFWLKEGARLNFISKLVPGVVVPFKIEHSGTQVIFNNTLK